MTYDKSTSAALVAAALADEERMTPGPWCDANGKGSAVVRSNHPDYNCAIYLNVRNGEVDECVERWQGDASAIASMRNRNLAMAEQIKAAMEEVERLAYDNGLLRADAKTWSCPDCAFTFCAYHTNEDGTLTCPLCELMAANKRIEALTSGRSAADIQRLADVVLDYMERNGTPPMWATETLCRLIKGGAK